MARYNDTENTIKAIKKRFNVYHEIPCSQDDRRVQEIIGIVIRTIEAQPTADVVPKSVLDEIEKTIRGALVLVDFSYKHNPKEIQCKKECYEDFLGYISELKKKYTEGET